MTEAEWLEIPHPMSMLEFLEGKVSDRKLRLFASTCCRHQAVWRRLSEQSRAVVEAAEHFADHGNGWGILAETARIAPKGRAGGSTINPVRLPLSGQAERAVLALAMEDAWEAAWNMARQAQNLLGSAASDVLREIVAYPRHSSPTSDHFSQAVVQLAHALHGGRDCGFALHDALLKEGHAGLAKHFRKRKTHSKECSALRHIIRNPFRLPLALPDHWPSSVVQLATALYDGKDCSFALHDALLEAGHVEFSVHFREKEHPKGCWAMDLILGKA